MRVSLLLMIIGLSSSVFAATEAFNMKMDLSIDGRHVSSPKVTALPNESASITQKNNETGEETFVDVTASDFSNKEIQNGILMKFVVGYIQAGERHILSRPQIIAHAGEEASIEQGKIGSSSSNMKLKVIANRIQK